MLATVMFIISEYHQEPDPSVEKVDTKAVLRSKTNSSPLKSYERPLKGKFKKVFQFPHFSGTSSEKNSAV